MQRTVFERAQLDGFRTQRVETIALSSAAQQLRLFAGTSEGTLVMYDCRPDTVANRSFGCTLLDTIRKQPKEKKPVTSLTIAESWGLLLGIMDGMVVAYNLQTLQQASQLPESKGCSHFSIHERSSLLVVASKKKITCYVWQGTGFILKKEITLADSVKSLFCVQNAILVGLKKSYEAIDLATLSSTTKILGS